MQESGASPVPEAPPAVGITPDISAPTPPTETVTPAPAEPHVYGAESLPQGTDQTVAAPTTPNEQPGISTPPTLEQTPAVTPSPDAVPPGVGEQIASSDQSMAKLDAILPPQPSSENPVAMPTSDTPAPGTSGVPTPEVPPAVGQGTEENPPVAQGSTFLGVDQATPSSEITSPPVTETPTETSPAVSSTPDVSPTGTPVAETTPTQEAVPAVPAPTDAPVSTDAIATPPSSEGSPTESLPTPDASAETPVAVTSDTPAPVTIESPPPPVDTPSAEGQAASDTPSETAPQAVADTSETPPPEATPAESASPAPETSTTESDSPISADAPTEELPASPVGTEDGPKKDLRTLRTEVLSDEKNTRFDAVSTAESVIEFNKALDEVLANDTIASTKKKNETWEKKGIEVYEYRIDAEGKTFTIVDSRKSHAGMIPWEKGGGFAPDKGVTIIRSNEIDPETITEEGVMASEEISWSTNPGEQKGSFYPQTIYRYTALFTNPETQKIHGEGSILASNDTYTRDKGIEILEDLKSSVSSSSASSLPAAA